MALVTAKIPNEISESKMFKNKGKNVNRKP